MVRVVLPGTLQQYTGGVTELDADAATIRQLFRVLGDKFPAIAPHLADGMAVAIDGQIYQDALLQTIPNNSETAGKNKNLLKSLNKRKGVYTNFQKSPVKKEIPINKYN